MYIRHNRITNQLTFCNRVFINVDTSAPSFDIRRSADCCRVISRIRWNAHTLDPSLTLFKSSNRILASILEINDSRDRVTGRRLRAAKNITALFIAVIKGYFREIEDSVVGSSSAINGEKREWWKQGGGAGGV